MFIARFCFLSKEGVFEYNVTYPKVNEKIEFEIEILKNSFHSNLEISCTELCTTKSAIIF